MTLQERIIEDMKAAMKAQNVIARDTLRVIKGEIERLGAKDVSDSEVIKVIKKSVEGIKETTNNLDELAVLEQYLPKAMVRNEIIEKVKEMRTSNPSANMGSLIKEFNSKYPGQADGKELSQIVREALS